MKLNKFILILTQISIIFIGCKSGNKYYYITGFARNFIEMDTGSVFVFKDSIKNTLDTLIVTLNSDQEYWQQFEGGIHTVHEICEMAMTRKNNRTDSSYFSLHFRIGGGGNSIQFSSFVETPDTLFGTIDVRLFEDNFITRSYLNLGVNYAIRVHDKLIVNGNQFSSVFENLFQYKDSSSHDFVRSYFAPTIGLVKFELKQGNYNTIKELVYYNIKRKKK